MQAENSDSGLTSIPDTFAHSAAHAQYWCIIIYNNIIIRDIGTSLKMQLQPLWKRSDDDTGFDDTDTESRG